jgi:hypothetical protein
VENPINTTVDVGKPMENHGKCPKNDGVLTGLNSGYCG